MKKSCLFLFCFFCLFFVVVLFVYLFVGFCFVFVFVFCFFLPVAKMQMVLLEEDPGYIRSSLPLVVRRPRCHCFRHGVGGAEGGMN